MWMGSCSFNPEDEEEENDPSFPETKSLALLLKQSSLAASGFFSRTNMASFHRLWLSKPPKICLVCWELDAEEEYTEEESLAIQAEDIPLVVQVDVASIGSI